MLSLVLLKYNSQCNFTVYDGINLCAWNGGRINRPVFYDEKIYNFYQKNNIGIALTLSNPIIDLNDKTGNELLELCYSPLNSIIIVNEELTRYIRKNFPKYKLIYSVTGHDSGRPLDNDLIAYYRDLESKYDLIVPRFEHIFDDRFIELNQSKYEVMTNDNCIYDCAHWAKHFQEDARINREFADRNPWEELGKDKCFKIEECWLSDFNPHIGDLRKQEELGEKYGMNLTTDQVRTLIDRGITNFKISGRELTSEKLRNELNLYASLYMKI